MDAGDRVLGLATRAEIHRKGLMHRAVHIFVFNPAGEIYVQRRSALKDRHPLKLDSSAAGHVDPGESYQRAAVRELDEELSFREPLEEVLRIPACLDTDNEHVVLYRAFTRESPIPNAYEIHSGYFMGPESLTNLMEEDPGDFVPAFVLLWKQYLGKTV